MKAFPRKKIPKKKTFSTISMMHAQESRMSCSQSSYKILEESRSSGVSALVSRLNSSNPRTDNAENEKSRCDTSKTMEQKMQDTFPWIPRFSSLCQATVGCRNVKALESLMNKYLENVTPSVKDCYSKVNRASKLKKNMKEVLIFFHFFYQEVKEALERSAYLDLMTPLVSMFMDMEIKASIRGKESLKKLAWRLTSSLYLFLDNSEEHMLDAILMTKYVNKNYREICNPLLWKLLNNISNRKDEMFYVRYLLTFKLWKKIVPDPEERNRINKTAVQKLQAPPNLLENIKALGNVLPRIPKTKKNITLFFMQSNFNLKDACQEFLKLVKKTKKTVYSQSFGNVDLDKPLFFMSETGSGIPLLSEKDVEVDSGLNTIDIWSSISVDSISSSSDMVKILNPSEQNIGLETTPKVPKKKRKLGKKVKKVKKKLKGSRIKAKKKLKNSDLVEINKKKKKAKKLNAKKKKCQQVDESNSAKQILSRDCDNSQIKVRKLTSLVEEANQLPIKLSSSIIKDDLDKANLKSSVSLSEQNSQVDLKVELAELAESLSLKVEASEATPLCLQVSEPIPHSLQVAESVSQILEECKDSKLEKPVEEIKSCDNAVKNQLLFDSVLDYKLAVKSALLLTESEVKLEEGKVRHVDITKTEKDKSDTSLQNSKSDLFVEKSKDVLHKESEIPVEHPKTEKPDTSISSYKQIVETTSRSDIDEMIDTTSTFSFLVKKEKGCVSTASVTSQCDINKCVSKEIKEQGTKNHESFISVENIVNNNTELKASKLAEESVLSGDDMASKSDAKNQDSAFDSHNLTVVEKSKEKLSEGKDHPDIPKMEKLEIPLSSSKSLSSTTKGSSEVDEPIVKKEQLELASNLSARTVDSQFDVKDNMSAETRDQVSTIQDSQISTNQDGQIGTNKDSQISTVQVSQTPVEKKVSGVLVYAKPCLVTEESAITSDDINSNQDEEDVLSKEMQSLFVVEKTMYELPEEVENIEVPNPVVIDERWVNKYKKTERGVEVEGEIVEEEVDEDAEDGNKGTPINVILRKYEYKNHKVLAKKSCSKCKMVDCKDDCCGSSSECDGLNQKSSPDAEEDTNKGTNRTMPFGVLLKKSKYSEALYRKSYCKCKVVDCKGDCYTSSSESDGLFVSNDHENNDEISDPKPHRKIGMKSKSSRDRWLVDENERLVKYIKVAENLPSGSMYPVDVDEKVCENSGQIKTYVINELNPMNTNTEVEVLEEHQSTEKSTASPSEEEMLLAVDLVNGQQESQSIFNTTNSEVIEDVLEKSCYSSQNEPSVDTDTPFKYFVKYIPDSVESYGPLFSENFTRHKKNYWQPDMSPLFDGEDEEDPNKSFESSTPKRGMGKISSADPMMSSSKQNKSGYSCASNYLRSSPGDCSSGDIGSQTSSPQSQIGEFWEEGVDQDSIEDCDRSVKTVGRSVSSDTISEKSMRYDNLSQYDRSPETISPTKDDYYHLGSFESETFYMNPNDGSSRGCKSPYLVKGGHHSVMVDPKLTESDFSKQSEGSLKNSNYSGSGSASSPPSQSGTEWEEGVGQDSVEGCSRSAKTVRQSVLSDSASDESMRYDNSSHYVSSPETISCSKESFIPHNSRSNKEHLPSSKLHHDENISSQIGSSKQVSGELPVVQSGTQSVNIPVIPCSSSAPDNTVTHRTPHKSTSLKGRCICSECSVGSLKVSSHSFCLAREGPPAKKMKASSKLHPDDTVGSQITGKQGAWELSTGQGKSSIRGMLSESNIPGKLCTGYSNIFLPINCSSIPYAPCTLSSNIPSFSYYSSPSGVIPPQRHPQLKSALDFIGWSCTLNNCTHVTDSKTYPYIPQPSNYGTPSSCTSPSDHFSATKDFCGPRDFIDKNENIENERKSKNDKLLKGIEESLNKLTEITKNEWKSASSESLAKRLEESREISKYSESGTVTKSSPQSLCGTEWVDDVRQISMRDCDHSAKDEDRIVSSDTRCDGSVKYDNSSPYDRSPETLMCSKENFIPLNNRTNAEILSASKMYHNDVIGSQITVAQRAGDFPISQGAEVVTTPRHPEPKSALNFVESSYTQGNCSHLSVSDSKVYAYIPKPSYYSSPSNCESPSENFSEKRILDLGAYDQQIEKAENERKSQNDELLKKIEESLNKLTEITKSESKSLDSIDLPKNSEEILKDTPQESNSEDTLPLKKRVKKATLSYISAVNRIPSKIGKNFDKSPLCIATPNLDGIDFEKNVFVRAWTESNTNAEGSKSVNHEVCSTENYPNPQDSNNHISSQFSAFDSLVTHILNNSAICEKYGDKDVSEVEEVVAAEVKEGEEMEVVMGEMDVAGEVEVEGEVVDDEIDGDAEDEECEGKGTPKYSIVQKSSPDSEEDTNKGTTRIMPFRIFLNKNKNHKVLAKKSCSKCKMVDCKGDCYSSSSEFDGLFVNSDHENNDEISDPKPHRKRGRKSKSSRDGEDCIRKSKRKQHSHPSEDSDYVMNYGRKRRRKHVSR